MSLSDITFAYRLVVSSAAQRDEFHQASRYLHDFCVKRRGRFVRSKIDWVGLDHEYAAVSSLMHLYVSSSIIIDPKVPNPYFLVANQDSGDVLVATSRYLANFGVSVKGKGKRKPGSKVTVRLDQSSAAMQFLCSLAQRRGNIIISSTPLPPYVYESAN